MKCSDCNKDLKDELIAFCEKCEKYYCIKCSIKHKTHGLTFARLKNDKINKINTGVGGAGPVDRHFQFYNDYGWILQKRRCSHVKEMMELGYPIFRCKDGKIRCAQCFFDSKITLADPLIKTEEKNKLMYLLTSKFKPTNLNFQFNCEKNGIKGQEINSKFKIVNNKIHPITDMNLRIEAFAADPIPENASFDEFKESLYQKYIVSKEVNINQIDPKETFSQNVKIKIPKDYEIKKGQICGFVIKDNRKDKYLKNGFLKIPDKLMIYSHFTYNTYLGFKSWSKVEKTTIELR
ncbi:hypothetical protein [uncultured Methanobrevibacter sp.]|uniref:hypothetical protein n=1 Tax=uncultured Methanobrevibacter sp. TaxID=253161 RepID=UPI0025EFA47E|nr:hypothetical protein [uncultured Methanobrevibacter sp.]